MTTKPFIAALIFVAAGLMQQRAFAASPGINWVMNTCVIQGQQVSAPFAAVKETVAGDINRVSALYPHLQFNGDLGEGDDSQTETGFMKLTSFDPAGQLSEARRAIITLTHLDPGYYTFLGCAAVELRKN